MRISGFTGGSSPRGIVAPLFHYWDREKNERIAEFDHAVLKDDTRFAFALQCERIKIVEEALAMAKADPESMCAWRRHLWDSHKIRMASPRSSRTRGLSARVSAATTS